ncbi:MAG TPA: hypothetical protein VFR67_03915 [Pilimelia sp.]|nr:hypothetical protein [Pilimelia sp.]
MAGGSGNDTLYGGPGNWIEPDSGVQPDTDSIDGGPGTDTVRYDLPTLRDPVTVDLDGVADDGAPGENDHVMTTVEWVVGTPGNDTIIGDAQDNRLTGGGGVDTLFGLGGNDALYGGSGSDLLDGGDGGDYLTADSGTDTLIGGPGDDRMYGGTDADTLLAIDGAVDTTVDGGLAGEGNACFTDPVDTPVDCT